MHRVFSTPCQRNRWRDGDDEMEAGRHWSVSTCSETRQGCCKRTLFHSGKNTVVAHNFKDGSV